MAATSSSDSALNPKPTDPDLPVSALSEPWLEAARSQGPTSVWSLVWRGHQARFLVYASLQLGPRLRGIHTAEDLVQEAWMRTLKSVRRSPDRATETLNSRMLLNIRRIATDWGRSANRRGSSDRPLETTSHEVGRPDRADSHPGPVTSASHRDDLMALGRSLEDERMRPLYRELLLSIYVEGRSREELSETRGIKLETLRKQVQRALTKWREILGDDPLRWL